ncbi:MAG TPA: GNAT family N-acetyltransferase [Bacteroidetes bacterium]|nr:GNAT family N-acetyltransferase [Bacteroidota bacterium]
MEIRPAKPAERKKIEALMQAAFGPFEHRYTKLAYANTVVGPQEILRRMTEGVTWVAVEGEEVVGTVSVAFEDDWLYVTGMAVAPAAQGKKIGYRMLEVMEKYALENGHRNIYLLTTKFLHRAQALYRGFGFRQIENFDLNWHGVYPLRFEKIL